MVLKSRVLDYFFCGVFSAFLCGIVAGCRANLVAKEVLYESYPNQYMIAAKPTVIWELVQQEAEKYPNSRILVRDAESHIISWIEDLSDKSEDSRLSKAENKEHGPSTFRNAEVSEVGPDGVALTTVCVLPHKNGSMIRVVRVYYGLYTQPNMVHSRGNYAYNLARRISNQDR